MAAFLPADKLFGLVDRLFVHLWYRYTMADPVYSSFNSSILQRNKRNLAYAGGSGKEHGGFMGYLIEKADLAVRTMEDSLVDYMHMAKWMTTPEVMDFYEGHDCTYDLEKVIDKYRPRTKGETPITPCIIEINHKAAGYLQFYPVDKEEYNVDERIDLSSYQHPYAADILLGEAKICGKGVGTKVLTIMIDYLFDMTIADVLYIDPQTWNHRAIRCYEKCGFKPVAVMEKRELHNGEYKDSLIMSITPVMRLLPAQ